MGLTDLLCIYIGIIFTENWPINFSAAKNRIILIKLAPSIILEKLEHKEKMHLQTISKSVFRNVN